MKEIGGYIELDTYHLPMPHEEAIALNCGRNCLAYLFRSKGIKKLKVPYFLCSSVFDVCDREGIEKTYYHIGLDFKPSCELKLEDGEWLYLVNFYGQLGNEEIRKYVERFGRVIVDQAHAFFERPLPGVDTLYTCRKWFGVADGAFLYTDKLLSEPLPRDESNGRMNFLLGRYERTAAEFYDAYKANNAFFAAEPVKEMSKLTRNLLHAIDYDAVRRRREENFAFLDEQFGSFNMLRLRNAGFMYPLMIKNGASVRKKLQTEGIYIPLLWPSVLEVTAPPDRKREMAEDILPLPVDQRYGLAEMKYMTKKIKELQELVR